MNQPIAQNPGFTIIDQSSLSEKASKSQSSHRKFTEKPINAIDVLSDQEEDQIICSKFQEEVFRAKIQQAKLTKSKFTILATLYTQLNFQGRNEQDKQKKFNSMVKGYVSKNLKTSTGQAFDLRNSHFFEKMVPKPNEDFIQNEYIIFGCDLLSQGYIEKMFKTYTPSIKWVDASHIKLTFLQKIKGWEAVVNNCRDIETLRKDLQASVKVQNLMKNLHIENQEFDEDMDIQGKNEVQYSEEWMKLQNFKKKYHLLKNYVQLTPYYELSFKRRLMIRNVTSSEQIIGYNLNIEQSPLNPPAQTQNKTKKDSDYKRFLKVKQALWKEIQNSPLVKPQYEMIQKQMLEQADLIKFRGRITAKSVHNNNNKRQQFNHNRDELQNKQNPYQKRNYQGNPYQRSSNRHYHGEANGYNSNNARNRSRQFQYNQQNSRGQYRGQNFDKNRNKGYRQWDRIQNDFDSYVERRDGMAIIQNPQKYLDPVYTDPKTGLAYYPNPLYDPRTEPHMRQIMAQNRINYPPTQYANQLTQNFPNSNDTSLSYQYQGNPHYQNRNKSYRNNYDRRGGNFNYGQQNVQNSDSRHFGQQIYQKSNQKSTFRRQEQSQAEQDFEKYCSEKPFIKNKVEVMKPQLQKAPVQQMNQNPINQRANLNILGKNQQIFQQDPNFSIISEEKPQDISFQNHQEPFLKDVNLDQILDQINDEEPPQNSYPMQASHFEDDSEDLQFMLRQKELKNLNSQVKIEPSTQRLPNSASNMTNFLVEKIKQEHIPQWLAYNHNLIEDSHHCSNVAENSQSLYQNQQSGYQGLMPNNVSSSMSNNSSVRKKVPKKKRDASKSQKKRKDSSLNKSDIK